MDSIYNLGICGMERCKEMGIEEFPELLINTDKSVDIPLGFNSVHSTQHPAILYDVDTYTLIKLGDFDYVKQYTDVIRGFLLHQSSQGEGSMEMHNCLNVMILPVNQRLIDRVFNTTGYFGIFLTKLARLHEDGIIDLNKVMY